MANCLKCGRCCRHLIVEIGCHDIVREPKLAAVAKPFRGVGGPCGFVGDGEGCGETIHDQPCHLLTADKPCPMLGEDGLCTIYSTRPNTCVGFPAGGQRCLELRSREPRGITPLS
jgi:Fe-S-cluster containining protein